MHACTCIQHGCYRHFAFMLIINVLSINKHVSSTLNEKFVPHSQGVLLSFGFRLIPLSPCVVPVASLLLDPPSPVFLSPTLSVLVDSLPLALPVLPLPVVVDVASLSSNFGEKSRYEVEQLIFI